MIKPFLLLLSGICITFSTLAQDAQKDFQTSSISIFKNGTAFFIKSGTVQTTESSYRITGNLPPALFGTYWMNAPSGELSALSSYRDTIESVKAMPINTLAELLYANLDRRALVHLEEEEVIQGTIVTMEEGENLNRQIVTVHTDNNHWRTVKLSDIRGVDFFEQPAQQFQRKQQVVKPVLQADFTTDKKEQQLDLMYLTGGLSWTPLYLIELTGEKRARMTLRAEVVNTTEDIEDTDVNFVVGVPNFSYATRISPLVDFSATDYAANLSPRSYDNFSNTIQAQSYSYAIEEDAGFSLPAATSGLDGSAEEDLYFYTLENMSLKKGGRGHYPVFTADINIAHIYECNLPQNNTDKYAYRDDFLFSPNPIKVFHSLKVVNDTKSPFTTGAALVVKQQGDTKPISQDRLNYTPVGGNSFIKLTEAPDVHIKQAEKAVNLTENAKKVNRGRDTYYYDLITVEGQVKVKNYKSQNIELNIRRPIIGELLQSSVNWLKAERINTVGDLNKMTDVCWETSVDAGAELVITYTYEIYVAH